MSNNPEIFWNLMQLNQINCIDETAYDTVGFDRHNALIWSFKAKISHGTKFDPKSPKFKVFHLARGGSVE